MCQVSQTAKSSCLNNRSSSHWSNTRYAHELPAISLHHIYRSGQQMPLCPCPLGINIDSQVAILQKRQILDIPTIIPEQKACLVQPVLASRVCRSPVLKRRLLNRTETRIIGSGQPHLS